MLAAKLATFIITRAHAIILRVHAHTHIIMLLPHQGAWPGPGPAC